VIGERLDRSRTASTSASRQTTANRSLVPIVCQ
jgi:hypothetical protein